MKKSLLTALLIFTTVFAFAKKEFPGYIIGLKGDTIKGSFKFKSYGKRVDLRPAYFEVRFAEDGSDDYDNYTSDDIKGYGFLFNDEWQHYRVYEVPRSSSSWANQFDKKLYGFVRIMNDGAFLKYYFYQVHQITGSGGSSFDANYHFVIKDGVLQNDFMGKGKNKRKEMLGELLSDCPSALNDDIDYKDLAKEDLQKIFDAYNKCRQGKKSK